MDVYIQGNKRDPTFVVTASSKVKLYVRNSDFLGSRQSPISGSKAVAVGQAMLPLTLNPKHLDISPLTTRTNATQVELHMDLQFPVSHDALRKHVGKLSSSRIVVQIEYEKCKKKVSQTPTVERYFAS